MFDVSCRSIEWSPLDGVVPAGKETDGGHCAPRPTSTTVSAASVAWGARWVDWGLDVCGIQPGFSTMSGGLETPYTTQSFH